MRYIFTVFVCKLFIFALRLTGHKGTSAPGKLALKLCPDILARFAAKTERGIIAVMGTNGKTTTNNLIADCFENSGFNVVCNRVGANMDEGAAVAYMENCSLFGSLKADYACLEMDEGWAEFIFKYITPTHIVVTNLFRDQLDRYGEVETTMEFLRRAIRLAPDAELILNGDDPITVAMAQPLKNPKLYYGIEESFTNEKSEFNEGKFCYLCGKELKYDFRHFSQMGKYSCGCGLARPQLALTAQNIKAFPALEFNIPSLGRLSFGGRGVYNVYNILGCALVCIECGIPFESVNKAASCYKPQIGRMERFTVSGRDVYLVLAKNPAGFNRSVASVAEDPEMKEIFIAVNDGLGDGRDVSWLWDVDFENIINDMVQRFCVSGKRYADVAVRLKYEGVEREKIQLAPDIKAALAETIGSGSKSTIYILANYTAVFEVQTVLKELSAEYGN